MRFRIVFEAALLLGALLAIVGGGALATVTLVAPELPILSRLEVAYRHVIFGFLFLTLFAVAAALLRALGAALKPDPVQVRAPSEEPALPLPAPARPAPPSRLEGLYHEMKTYVDLEMWELALEKANLVVKDFPGTREAELVAKNINELRWKAEPKFLAQSQPLTVDQERQLREKGLAQMYQHVKTYMELGMWELARQKAIAIMKNFPDSPEATELMKVFETIEKKAQESSRGTANVEF